MRYSIVDPMMSASLNAGTTAVTRKSGGRVDAGRSARRPVIETPPVTTGANGPSLVVPRKGAAGGGDPRGCSVITMSGSGPGAVSNADVRCTTGPSHRPPSFAANETVLGGVAPNWSIARRL